MTKKKNNTLFSGIILPEIKELYIKACEKVILEYLGKHAMNREKAAQDLGIPRTTLTMWLKKYRPDLLNYTYKMVKKG